MAMTYTPPDPNNYLAPVLIWLEAGAPSTTLGLDFNMLHFHRYGTDCCIAGACAQFNRLTLTSPACDPVGQCYEVGRIIGLTSKQTDNLFFPEDQTISPETAAHALRTFMETGTADWSYVYDQD